MNLVLLRHGNTFGPGDKVVMVGARNDLPLVARGEAQARECGQALLTAGVQARRLYAAPLVRTRRFAELVGQPLDLASVSIDERLREVDYGAWTGLSDEEIAARYGAEALRAWREHGLWPGDFAERPEKVQADVAAFVAEVQRGSGDAIAVTSAGVLRFFLALDSDAYAAHLEARKLSFRTGHLALLELDAGNVRARIWDASPESWPALWAEVRAGRART